VPSLGKTYDRAFVDLTKAVGFRADATMAVELYRKAIALDRAEAPFCSERLKARGNQRGVAANLGRRERRTRFRRSRLFWFEADIPIYTSQLTE
jgi:hypothetical protein